MTSEQAPTVGIEALLKRARIKSGMLRMGEPIAFGSDADVIDELIVALLSLTAENARLTKRAEAAEAKVEELTGRLHHAVNDKLTAEEAAEASLTAAQQTIERLTEALREHVTNTVWSAYNAGLVRADGMWIDAGMSDAEWLVAELGIDPPVPFREVRDRVPSLIEPKVRAVLSGEETK